MGLVRAPIKLDPDVPRLNPALRDFWHASHCRDGVAAPANDNDATPIRNRVLYGGRASSKSWDAAGFAIFLASNFKCKFLCARQFQNKIEESVYALLVIQIDRFGLRDQFRILDNKIIHRRTGSEFIFYGLWRHISEIKSLEGIDICWIEEAHALTEAQWEILEPTVRKEGSQFWIIFNPQLATDFAYKRFVTNPPAGTIKRQINYDENPFLSQTMLSVIQSAANDDYEEYEHIYLGVPRDDDDDAVIKRSWIMAAIDAHKTLGITPTGSDRIGYDVADGGKDKCAMIYAHGRLAAWADQWKSREDEAAKSTRRAWQAAGERSAEIVYDSIGVGSNVGSWINELNKPDAAGRIPTRVAHAGFNAGGGVFRPDALYGKTKIKNIDMFANLKAQAWWLVADAFRLTFRVISIKRKQENGDFSEPMPKYDEADLIFLEGDMPFLSQLIEELATPKRDTNAAGKVAVESKKDLAKSTRPGGPVPSPNLADAFIMAFAPRRRPMMIDEDALRAA